MRRSIVAVAICLAAGCSAALAQDAGPPMMMPPRETMPPPSAEFAPGVLPPASTTPPAPATPPALATPRELVGKSIDDLSKGKLGAAARDDIKALRRGPLLIHGNYCGIGNRPGSSPVDALDSACMRHDACTHAGTLPSCRCDDRLRAEALEIAQDPETSPEIAALATATAASMAVLLCK